MHGTKEIEIQCFVSSPLSVFFNLKFFFKQPRDFEKNCDFLTLELQKFKKKSHKQPMAQRVGPDECTGHITLEFHDVRRHDFLLQHAYIFKHKLSKSYFHVSFLLSSNA